MGTLRGFGSAQVGRAVLQECTKITTHEFLAFVPNTWRSDFSGHANLTLVGTRPSQFDKLRTDQWAVRKAMARHTDVKLFSLTDTGTIGAGFPHLLLVHQAALAAPDRHLDFPLSPMLSSKMWLMGSYFKAAIRSVDRFTVQTRYMQTGLNEKWGIPEDRIEVIPSAVPMPEELLGTWKADTHGDPFILYPSSAYAHKNHGVLFEALRLLNRVHPSLRCGLTIERHQAPALVAQARQAGVLHMINWLGSLSVKAVWGLMSESAVVVVPSKLESFGLVYWEALAIGAPIVAADRPFAREACAEVALYADADDAEAFAAAISTLLTDKSLSQARSQLGSHRYRNHTRTWPSVVRNYLEILQSI